MVFEFKKKFNFGASLVSPTLHLLCFQFKGSKYEDYTVCKDNPKETFKTENKESLKIENEKIVSPSKTCHTRETKLSSTPTCEQKSVPTTRDVVDKAENCDSTKTNVRNYKH